MSWSKFNPHDLERRPNPPGWIAPRAPYNPFDPTDARPAEGYPSEFNEPIPKDWRVKAGENPEYRAFIDRMRMEAYPGSAPSSDLYPGRRKVLRQLRQGAFVDGAHYASVFLCSAIIIYGTFFYRWNEGYDNVFSGPYRLQLRIRKFLTGNLTKQQEEDLLSKKRSPNDRIIDSSVATNKDFRESEWAVERPRRTHKLEAERALQERDEHLLGASVLPQSTEDLTNSDNRNSISFSRKWYQIWR
ncbi:hypothetical protein V1511DRAFT_494472 [Dipodascopsis uninucleata]